MKISYWDTMSSQEALEHARMGSIPLHFQLFSSQSMECVVACRQHWA